MTRQGWADRKVTQTALAIRDADELEAAASILDAALRCAKAEGMRLAVQEQRCWEDVLRTEYRNVPTFEAWIDARAAQIEAEQ